MKQGTYPELNVGSYNDQRLHDPNMKVRDVGHAIAATLLATASDYSDMLPLDSEAFRERLGKLMLLYLEDAGYRIEFHRLAAHR